MRIMVCFYYYALGAHVNPPPPLGCIFNVCDPARIKVDSLSKALGFWNGKLFFFFPLWLLSMQTSPPCYDWICIISRTGRTVSEFLLTIISFMHSKQRAHMCFWFCAVNLLVRFWKCRVTEQTRGSPMVFRVRRIHATAALRASTNRFTFHFPGDSAVVHFKGTVVVQVWLVQAGALFVKRCVSCLLCSRNQRGNTESICLWREGTAVVHRQGIESGKAVPPPPPPPLSNRAESRRRLRTMGKNMRQNGVFTFRYRRSVGARVCFGLFSKYSHGYCEDAKSSPPFRFMWWTPKHVLVSKHSSSAERERERFPCFSSDRWRGGVIWVLPWGEATTAPRMSKVSEIHASPAPLGKKCLRSALVVLFQ